jgi:hypothetical protein
MDHTESLESSRFRTAMDLFAAGEAMMRLKLARANPALTADEIEELLTRWLRQRPGAERGDCPGPSRPA